MNVCLKILSLCLLLSAFGGAYGQCGWVYGKVVDGSTGERLSGVMVTLLQDGETIDRKMTTDDGSYRFGIPREDKYRLMFEKSELDSSFYAAFPVRCGDSIRKDASLQKTPRFIRITEVNDPEKEIKMLDVGALTEESLYYVDFFNSGEVDIEYVTGTMSEWITSVTPSSGILRPNESIRITIKINPEKFEAGRTTGKVLVMTNNGNAVLPIKAIGKFPEITMLPIEGYFPSKFQCQISFNGKHTFKEVGYCFSDKDTIPAIDAQVVLAFQYMLDVFEYNDVLTYGVTGKYEFPWLEGTELFDPEFACRTYYVRAFLRYGDENDIVIYSGNVEQFTLWDILCP